MSRVEDYEGDTWPPRLNGPAEPGAMFRVKDTEGYTRIPTTAAIVLGTLLLALALGAAAVYQVLEEYRLLGTWLIPPGPARAAEIQALRQDIGTRIIIRSAALVVLQGLRIFNIVCSKHLGQVVIIPTTPQPLGLEARVGCLLLLQQADGQLPQQGQVLTTVACMVPAVVLAKHDIQHPVQRVLNAPVPTDRIQVLLRRPHETADVVPHLNALDALDHATAQEHADRCQALPQRRITQPRGPGNHMTLPHLIPAAIHLLSPSHAVLQARKVGLQPGRESGVDVLVQVRLVLLDGQDRVPAALNDLGGDLPLAAPRVDRHQGAGQVEQLQQAGDRGDLVRLVVHRYLAQADVVGPGPGADQVPRRQA